MKISNNNYNYGKSKSNTQFCIQWQYSHCTEAFCSFFDIPGSFLNAVSFKLK